MNPERIAELRAKASRMDADLEGYWLTECLDEIEALQTECRRQSEIPAVLQKQVERLHDALTAEKAEIERLQGELKTLRETPTGVAVTLAQRLGRELATLKAEGDAIHGPDCIGTDGCKVTLPTKTP